MTERSAGGASPTPIIDLQRFAESKRDRLVRLGRERRVEARRLEARAKVVSQEARAYTRQGRPGAAAAARSEAADLRARAARQKELAAQYSRELAELRAERARERARRRARILREREARRRRKRVVRRKPPAPKRLKPVKRGGRKPAGYDWRHLTEDRGYIWVTLGTKKESSTESRWHHAVDLFLAHKRGADVFRRFGGKTVYDLRTRRRHPFVTDPNVILEHADSLYVGGDVIYRDRSDVGRRAA